MGFFDQLKNKAAQTLNSAATGAARSAAANATQAVSGAVNTAVRNAGTKKETFTFTALPQNVSELQALPEAALTSPFQTAALTVAVLCHYEVNVPETIDMLNFLKGPQPLSGYEEQFLKNYLLPHVPRSYLAGTSPANNYQPTEPYQITIFDGAHSYDQQGEGYVILNVNSSGADNPRQVKLRRKGEQWFLWEQFLLPSIREPAANDPWA